MILALVLVKAAGGHGGKGGKSKVAAPSPVPASVMQAVSNVPESTMRAVGTGTVTAAPKGLPSSTPALTSGGHPEILYVGAEYCPFCAAERWSMVVALSRFGTFGGLGSTTSSAVDQFPSTPTFTFYRSTYSSKYLVFTPVETETNQLNATGGAYVPLQKTTPAQDQIVSTFDAAPYTKQPGSIPFVDFGGKAVQIGASYSPQVLQGLSMEQIATGLADPASPVAKAIDGSANQLTAAICAATGNQPSDVCTLPEVSAAQTALKLVG